jgi:hypothetical protein
MPSALMGKLGRTTRLPDDGRDVAETDVGASEADVAEEMIVKLQKVCSDPARLNRLAAPQDRGNQATGKEKDCTDDWRAGAISLTPAEAHERAVTKRLEGPVVQVGRNGAQEGHRGCSRLASHPR